MKKIDLQDVLLLAGVASIVGGVGMWSHPAAAVVFGLFFLVGVRTIARNAPRDGAKPERRGN